VPRLCLFVFVFFLLTAANSQVQTKALSNDDVIQMTSLGLSDDVIIERFDQSPRRTSILVSAV